MSTVRPITHSEKALASGRDVTLPMAFLGGMHGLLVHMRINQLTWQSNMLPAGKPLARQTIILVPACAFAFYRGAEYIYGNAQLRRLAETHRLDNSAKIEQQMYMPK